MTPEELREKWPTAKEKLQVGDIILLHKRRGPISKAIRQKTDSYWNHTALVFKDREIIKFGTPLIIEAYNDGIEIHRLQKYTDNFEEYDIGVKRFPGFTTEERSELVKSFMLNNIDVPYDYTRLLTFYFANLLKKISEQLYMAIFTRATHEDHFLCSTFVHKTFHQFKKHKTIREKDAKFAKYKQEEMVTPGMIAKDKDFEWIFNPVE